MFYGLAGSSWGSPGWAWHRVEYAAPPGAPRRRGPQHGEPLDESAIRSRVEEARSGVPGALPDVLAELRPDVVRLCARLLGGVDAEDAANEACLRAQSRFASYDSSQPFRRWLLSVASNYCIDQLRRRRVEQRLFDPAEADFEALPGRGPSALDGIVKRESQVAVQAALDRLEERYRAPIVLRYMAELDYDAIAEALGISRSQVATLLFRGKRRLRDMLGREGREVNS